MSKNGIINKSESTDPQSCDTLHLCDNNKTSSGMEKLISALSEMAQRKKISSLVRSFMSHMAAAAPQPGGLFPTNAHPSPHLYAKLCGMIRLTVWRKSGYWY